MSDTPVENKEPASSVEGAGFDDKEISEERKFEEANVDSEKTWKEKREGIRGRIAQALTVCFMFQILVPLIFVLLYPDTIDEMSKLINVILPPTVAVLGTVLGFYFGSKPGEEKS